MEKRIIIIVTLLLFSFSCEVLEEFNYVVCYVTGTVQVGKYDFANNKWVESLHGEAVEMSLIKAGGERVEDIGTTASNSAGTSIHATFNLYKEQPIDFKAKLVSNPMITGEKRVTWEYVEKNKRYGGENKPDECWISMYIPLLIPIE